MPQSKDLFDESTMSFGDHLEILRVHLWKAILGTVVCVIGALFLGNHVINIVRGPIDAALVEHDLESEDDISNVDIYTNIKAWFGNEEAIRILEERRKKLEQIEIDREDEARVTMTVEKRKIKALMHELYPNLIPEPSGEETGDIALPVSSDVFKQFQNVRRKQQKPVTLTVQEAFMTYLKVSLVAGFVVASPWVFYQMWLFVAAGLYPHERRYVHIFLPMSIGLFMLGAFFCFRFVLPIVLNFLLGFNKWIEVHPQIRLSEWISFAIMLPLMFGISFQLPLVMLFLQRISIFDVKGYREKRRMAILVIAILSMFLTPSDPLSMIMMMIPLIFLYELGIIMCNFYTTESPFEDTAVD